LSDYKQIVSLDPFPPCYNGKVSYPLAAPPPLFNVENIMEKQTRPFLAAWMLVPAVLAAPALISGLSIWFDWGPDLLLLALAAATAVLAALVDHTRALRWALIGGALGAITSPLLLLQPDHSWTLFAWWLACFALAAALLVPLLWDTATPPRRRTASRTPAPGAEAPAREGSREGSREGLAQALPRRADR
jgi:hypothetical protein